MKKLRTEEVQIKMICFGMILVLAAVLIPLFWISGYNFLSVDDYSFLQNSGEVWRESHSVFTVFAEQVKDTWQSYQNWQGTFFSQWFFSSMIGIFGESAYYVGTILSLGGFAAAELLFLMVTLVKGLGADKCRAMIVSASCIVIQVLLTPAPTEAFFWFCGAVVYTFIHALSLVLLTLLFLLEHTQKEKKKDTILLEVGIVFLTIAVGGSNYVTALTILIFYVLHVAWVFWQKNPHKILILSDFILYLIAFGVNIMAPGNWSRQDASGMERMSIVASVLRSLQEALKYCLVNINPPCVILGLLLVPILYGIVKRKNFRYPLPLLVSIFSFCIFAAQFTPTLYALHITGAGRIQNLYRFNFYLLVFGNELYWLGWLSRRWGEIQTHRDNCYLLPGWILGGVLLCMSLAVWGGSTVTSTSALQSLHKGEAQRYHAEYEKRLSVLRDASVEVVELEPFSVKPYLLFFGDVVEDSEDWVNKAMAEYFGKKSVKLKE